VLDQKAIRREHDIAIGLHPPFQPKKPVGLIATERRFVMESKHEYREYEDRLALFRASKSSVINETEKPKPRKKASGLD
jgi:hypothetical protein